MFFLAFARSIRIFTLFLNLGNSEIFLIPAIILLAIVFAFFQHKMSSGAKGNNVISNEGEKSIGATQSGFLGKASEGQQKYTRMTKQEKSNFGGNFRGNRTLNNYN